MQKYTLALLASAAVLAGPAAAGENGKWSGLYAGFHLGATEMSADTTRTLDTNTYLTDLNRAAVEAAGAIDFEDDGFVGGFQIGYNYAGDLLLFGVEADVSYSSVDVSQAAIVVYPDSPLSSFQTDTRVDQDWLGTLRARLGYDVLGALLYATGGLAVGQVEFRQGFSDNFIVPYTALTTDEIRTGWTAGGGIEVPVFGDTTMKLEYLRIDLGTTELSGQPFSGYPGTFQTGRVDIVHDTVRLGMNWNLN